MPAEQVITELVIDDSDVDAARVRVGSAFDHMGSRADAAQAKFDKMMEGQLRIGGSIPQALDRVSDAYQRIQGKLDPVVAAQQRMEREMVQSLGVINRAVLLGVATEEQAARDIARLKSQQIEHINRVRDAQVQANNVVRLQGGANDNDPMSAGRRTNLGYQAFDIAQGAALGTPLALIAAQQGPQIAQLYAAQGGLNALWKDASGILIGLARAAGPWIAAAAAMYGAYRLLMSFSRDAAIAVDDATAALAAQAAPLGAVKSAIGELAGLQKTYQDALRSTGDISDEATSKIIANTRREFEAKKALLELEKLRQEAAMKVNDAEIARASVDIQGDVARGVLTRSDLERQGFADPRIGSVPFVRLPDDVTGVQKTQEIIENSPVFQRIKELRAQGELTRLTYEGLVEALGSTFEGGELIKGKKNRDEFGNPFPMPTLRGVDDQAGLTDHEFDEQYLRSGRERIAQLENERAALGLTNAAAESFRYQMEAVAAVERDLGVVTEDQRKLILQQAEAYGVAVEAMSRARLAKDAMLERQMLGLSDGEADIARQMTGAGLQYDPNSAEAAQLRVNQRLREQVDLWKDIRQSGMDAYSDIFDLAFDGFENWEDTLSGIGKDLAKQLFDLNVKNPFLNEQYPGSNLPTLDQTGGLGGWIGTLLGGTPNPASQAVGAMTVSAATVVVNGAIGGDLGSLVSRLADPNFTETSRSTFSEIMGAAKSTSNEIIRLPNPPLDSAAPRSISGIGSPSASPASGSAYSVENATSFIRNYAQRIGIDPDTAVRVAQSEGLGPDIWQSNYRKGNFREPSFGPFQLLKGGQGTGFEKGLGNEFQNATGLDPADPKNWQQSTAFALQQAKQSGWGAWYGAKKIGVTGFEGIDRSAPTPAFAQAAAQAGRGLDFVGNYKPGTDARLTDILDVAAQRFPGYEVKGTSGYRPSDPRFHGKRMATDVQLYKDGVPLDNYQNASTFRDYEKFAQTARRVQLEKYPELNDDFRWGGYFSGKKGKYGANDPMHFDLGGERVGMKGGSWEGGLTKTQKSLWPGIQSEGMGEFTKEMTAANLQLKQMATKVVPEANQNLGTLGKGFDAFGDALAKAPVGGGAGGGAGGGGLLSSIFSSIFGGFTGAPVSGVTSMRLAGGGPIHGPGTATSDSIPIWASNGEFMVNAAATAKHRPLLEAINTDRLPRMADGGMVARPRWEPIRMPSPQQAPAAAAPQFRSETHVHNYAGVQVRTQEKDDGNGGRRTDIIIEEKLAAAITRRGGAADRALDSRGLARPVKRRT